MLKLGGSDRDRTYCDLRRRSYSPLPYHYGGTSLNDVPVIYITTPLRAVRTLIREELNLVRRAGIEPTFMR